MLKNIFLVILVGLPCLVRADLGYPVEYWGSGGSKSFFSKTTEIDMAGDRYEFSKCGAKNPFPTVNSREVTVKHLCLRARVEWDTGLYPGYINFTHYAKLEEMLASRLDQIVADVRTRYSQNALDLAPAEYPVEERQLKTKYYAIDPTDPLSPSAKSTALIGVAYQRVTLVSALGTKYVVMSWKGDGADNYSKVKLLVRPYDTVGISVMPSLPFSTPGCVLFVDSSRFPLPVYGNGGLAFGPWVYNLAPGERKTVTVSCPITEIPTSGTHFNEGHDYVTLNGVRYMVNHIDVVGTTLDSETGDFKATPPPSKLGTSETLFYIYKNQTTSPILSEPQP